MNRRWITLAIIVVAIIGVANVFILLVLVPRWSKAANTSAPASAPAPAQVAAASPAAVASAPVNGTVATGQPAAAAAPHHPKPPTIQPGMRLERQVLTPSGQLRVRYLRDRQQGIRQIALQEVKNPANETVLAQYKRNAWVVVSPNDDWIILETREKGDSGVQLFHRVSTSPLKYEVPEELRASGSELREMIWQTYLDDTQQDPNLDRRRVTIDATQWEPDSQKVTLSVAPVPSKDSSAELPVAWTCFYNVSTRQLEPAEEQTAQGPNENRSGAPEEMTGAQAPENAAAENGESAAPNDQPQELEGEKFPATREQEITVADANELELADVKYAIFEMFARHGAPIDDSKMRETFSQFPWYQPRDGFTFDEAEKEFSDIEKHNLDVLRRVRAAKIAVSRRPERKAIKGQPVEEESNSERVLRGVLQGVSDALNGGNQ